MPALLLFFSLPGIVRPFLSGFFPIGELRDGLGRFLVVVVVAATDC